MVCKRLKIQNAYKCTDISTGSALAFYIFIKEPDFFFSIGSVLHIWAPLIEKADWPKEVFPRAISQFPLAVPLVILLLFLC